MNDDQNIQNPLTNNKAINPPATDEDKGQSDIAGSTSDSEDVQDIDKSYKEAFGNYPSGKTIAEEIDEDEKERQGE